jgi:maltose O-acetyltransferase
VREVLARLRGEATLARLQAQGLQIGRDVYAAKPILIDAGFPWLVSIGDGTTFGPGVEVIVHDASTKRHIDYSVLAPVRIGCDVYIGARSIILPGVTIGDRSIVGAGSVVRRDVPPGSLVMGNPAEVVSTTDRYIARHRAQLTERPHWPADGWTMDGGIDDARKAEQRDALSQTRGYIE